MKILAGDISNLDKERYLKLLAALREMDGNLVIFTGSTKKLIFEDDGSRIKIRSREELIDLPVIVRYHAAEIGRYNKVRVFTNASPRNDYEAIDNPQAKCFDINTDFGSLTVYALCARPYKGTGKAFKADIEKHVKNLKKLYKDRHLCVAGNFNTCFRGEMRSHPEAQKIINRVLKKFDLVNLTQYEQDCFNHIALSEGYIKGKFADTDVWNKDRKLCDHIGTVVTIDP